MGESMLPEGNPSHTPKADLHPSKNSIPPFGEKSNCTVFVGFCRGETLLNSRSSRGTYQILWPSFIDLFFLRGIMSTDTLTELHGTLGLTWILVLCVGAGQCYIYVSVRCHYMVIGETVPWCSDDRNSPSRTQPFSPRSLSDNCPCRACRLLEHHPLQLPLR